LSRLLTGSSASLSAKDLEALLDVIVKHPLDRAKRDLIPLRDLEQEYINWVLERTGGNKTRAAEILGIDPSTLYRREVRGKA
jgi:DNA-binding NtrC family response regulator